MCLGEGIGAREGVAGGVKVAQGPSGSLLVKGSCGFGPEGIPEPVGWNWLTGIWSLGSLEKAQKSLGRGIGLVCAMELATTSSTMLQIRSSRLCRLSKGEALGKFSRCPFHVPDIPHPSLLGP